MSLYSYTSPSLALSQHENAVSLFNSTAEQKHKIANYFKTKKEFEYKSGQYKAISVLYIFYVTPDRPCVPINKYLI